MRFLPATLMILAFGAVTYAAGPDANWDFEASHEAYVGKLESLELAAAREWLRRERLTFSRWTQVMVRFEQGMHSNPDQDLGRLWWNLSWNEFIRRATGEPLTAKYFAADLTK